MNFLNILFSANQFFSGKNFFDKEMSEIKNCRTFAELKNLIYLCRRKRERVRSCSKGCGSSAG